MLGSERKDELFPFSQNPESLSLKKHSADVSHNELLRQNPKQMIPTFTFTIYNY